MKHTDRKSNRKGLAAGIGAAALILSLSGCAANTGLTDKAETAGSETEITAEMTETGLPEGESLQAPEMNGERPELPEGGKPGMNGETSQFPGGQHGGFAGGQQPGGMQQGTAETASEPTAIVTSDVVCTAAELTADEAGADTIVMSESNAEVKIENAGTYIITGSCKDGSITVKKGTTGVVLILKDLDLTSTEGAALSCNKGSEVKIIIRGSVKLTDAEDPADEESADAEVADAFDGAALKVKDGANVYLTGTGTLTIDASSCKNGIKVGDEDTPCFVIDGDLTVNITAANDGINGGYDVTILSGTLNIAAGDDGIHADRILTLGKEDGTGPTVNVTQSKEGLEGTVVDLFGGTGSVKASDDAVNAANSDGTYSLEMSFSVNITGGSWDINSGGDGLDSNGNINITGGSTTIRSASNGGEAGLDYMGSLYVADGALTNYSGISFDSGKGGGQMGPGGGQMPGWGGQRPGQGQMPGGHGGQMPGGEMPGQDGSQTPGQSDGEGQTPGEGGSQMPGGQMPGQGGSQTPGGQRPGRGGRH